MIGSWCWRFVHHVNIGRRFAHHRNSGIYRAAQLEEFSVHITSTDLVDITIEELCEVR
jgi:hypothetical protein